MDALWTQLNAFTGEFLWSGSFCLGILIIRRSIPCLFSNPRLCCQALRYGSLPGPWFSPRSGLARRMMAQTDVGGSMCESRLLNELRKARGDLATAIVPAGTSSPAIKRELGVLCYATRQLPPLTTTGTRCHRPTSDAEWQRAFAQPPPWPCAGRCVWQCACPKLWAPTTWQPGSTGH